MATARPFAYNTGSPITGTDQVGNLAIGTPTDGFVSTGLQWWNGPNEDLGYVIAHPTVLGNQPNPLNIPAYLGFYRSIDKTDQSFIDLATWLTEYIGTPQTFATASDASTWLTTNGFWNSYGGSVTIGPYFLQFNYIDANQNGWITFPNHNVGTWSDNPNLIGQSGFALYINRNDNNGNNNSSALNKLVSGNGTLTLTQGSNSAVYSYTSPNGFLNGISTEYYWDNYFESSQLGTLTLTSSASSVFNNIDPISITIT